MPTVGRPLREGTRRPGIDVVVQRASNASGLPADDDFSAWVGHALSGQRARAELTIRVVDEAEGRELNRTFRQRDYATNVLSFPVEGLEQLAPDMLGDIVLCANVVATEAHEQGKPLHAHWAHLTVHGVLHLLGFDHQDDAAAEVMEARERAVLARLGIADPYAA